MDDTINAAALLREVLASYEGFLQPSVERLIPKASVASEAHHSFERGKSVVRFSFNYAGTKMIASVEVAPYVPK